MRDDSQFIIATHSPIWMAYPDAMISSFSTDGVRQVDTQDTEHYQVTRALLMHPRRMLDALLERSPDTPVQPARRKAARR